MHCWEGHYAGCAENRRWTGSQKIAARIPMINPIRPPTTTERPTLRAVVFLAAARSTTLGFSTFSARDSACFASSRSVCTMPRRCSPKLIVELKVETRTGDGGVHALLAVVGHRHRLGVALGLVVDAPWPDRVDVPPVGLGLRMNLRIAVHLARRREHEARPLELREPERIVRPVRADLQGQQRQAQVVDRARDRREVEDEADRALDRDRLHHVVVDELEIVAPQVLDVLERGGLEIVHADHVVPLREQVLTQMGAEKAGSPRDDRSGHSRGGYPGLRRAPRMLTKALRAKKPC